MRLSLKQQRNDVSRLKLIFKEVVITTTQKPAPLLAPGPIHPHPHLHTGFGNSGRQELGVELRRTWLQSFLIALNLPPCVVVSPSFSGVFSLPMLLLQPHEFDGFVPIAVDATDEIPAHRLQSIRVRRNKSLRSYHKDLQYLILKIPGKDIFSLSVPCLWIPDTPPSGKQSISYIGIY